MGHKRRAGSRCSALLLAAAMTLSAVLLPPRQVAAAEETALYIDTGAAVRGGDGNFTFPDLQVHAPAGQEVKSVTVQFTSVVEAADTITLPTLGDFTRLSGSKEVNVSINASGKSCDDWSRYLRENLKVKLAGDDMKKLRLVASYEETTDIYDYDAESGHYYQAVKDEIVWAQALTEAADATYMGMQGYLVTVTSKHENDIITSLVKQNTWMGGTCHPDYTGDAAGYTISYGKYYWVTGPESLDSAGNFAPSLFWQGAFSQSQANNPSSTVIYSNWNGGEPNNGQNKGTEYCLHMWGTSDLIGTWNDGTPAVKAGYIIEYGGMPGDKPVTDGGGSGFSVVDVNLDPTGKSLSTSAKDIFVGQQPEVSSKANGSQVDAVTHVYYERDPDGTWAPVEGLPTHVGEYRVESVKEGYNGDSDTFSVLPIELSVAPADTDGQAYTKIYDGGTDYSGGFVLSGLPEGAKVGLSCTATYNSKNVAEADTITLTEVALTGEDAGDYVLTGLTDGKVTVPGTITPRPLAVCPTFAVTDSWAGVPLADTYGHSVTGYDPDGSWGSMLAGGDRVEDTLGAPVYSCRAGDIELDRGNPAAGTYVLAVDFPDSTALARQNYAITYSPIQIVIRQRQAPQVRPGEEQDTGGGSDPGGTQPEYLVPDAVSTEPDGTVHATITDAVTVNVQPSGSLSRIEVAQLLRERYQISSVLPDGLLTYSAATIFKGGALLERVDLTQPGSYLLSITATDSLGNTTTILLDYTLKAPQLGVDSDSDDGHQNPSRPEDGELTGTIAYTGDHGIRLAVVFTAAAALGGAAFLGGKKNERRL
ncbi:hypothetical protein H8K20_06815 [Neobittarella massiliensis]|uniref:C-type lectin domain-containing protein n=1 Tax=Neobittarella massiliensis (ex Bilen et al. 2018) TaxID=2041842 RepID=A0A8J6LV16_9FIRM|nr:YDG domain-containing protein [Neobittarella massiliensis]MBC3516105.1 hypothetical protein [Neobittarella massiliensis]